MKIFVGTSEIAGMMTFLSKALIKSGHQVTTCVDNYGEGFYNFSYDIILNKPVFRKLSSNRYIKGIQVRVNNWKERATRRKVFRDHRDIHDVYIFMWNGFFKNDVSDYRYLKSKGKTIISIFLGSDVRHISAFVQEYKLDVSTWEQWFHTTSLNEQLFRLRKAELFSDAIFSVKDQDGLAIRPYYKMYIPFDATKIKFNYPGREIPKIVHIPSRSGIKGTTHILKALEELKREGVEFEFEFISGVPNLTVLEKLQDADILVDELYLYGPGTLSLEGMASGCAVATKTIKGEIYDQGICGVEILNVKDRLKKLITDYEFRKKLAYNGRKLVENVNDPMMVAQRILEKTSSQENEYDYHPRFFSDHYEMPGKEDVNDINRQLTREIIKKFNLSSINYARLAKEKLS